MPANGHQLYDQIGGQQAVQSITADFYKRLMQDTSTTPFLRTFFEDLPTDVYLKLQRHVGQAISLAIRGEVDESVVQYLKKAHKHLPITTEHFDATVGHLIEAMKAGGAEAAIPAVAALVPALKEAIVKP